MSDPKKTFQLRQALASHQPSAFLLAAQLLQLVFYLVIDEPLRGQILLSGFGMLALVLVVWVVNWTPALDWIAWALAIPAFILLLLSVLLSDMALLTWSSLLEAVLYFYAAGSLISYMLGDTKVTTDELFAAGATFTLFAWGFAYAYLVCQAWYPGSLVSGLHPGQPLNFIELLSLSFTNLSATGLSDILPASTLARVLVMLEQFAGVGYIAVVVSRLIGLTTNHRGSSREKTRRDGV